MSTSEEPIIKLDGITKTYATGEVAVQVLKGVDLEIYPREYVALMGRSGAGKSTLMNILGCLDRPTDGAYYLAGQDVSSLEDDRLSIVRGKTIGFIFQSFHLLKDLNVRENVELPMEYQGVDVRERKERAESLLVRVGLGHRLDHYPRQLSGGERQRVAIARALSNKPRVLLADEPTGNLDSAARDSVLELFEELIDQENITLVMVTHDDLIGELAERRIIVADGKILDDGLGGKV
ncbi:MAG: ABC transporter ATP-binding protein [Myxococcota bacterium]|jgi:putative ABC transport system ATP-binding protein|nr:ABC transporter ATP-binding protein [Myxococcota bacterium]MEC9442740.1 ABC transporter ATP-binding protein [Myxococcota bacterium]